MHFFTSVTTCYSPKARVLAKTLKEHNPDAIMHLVISDDLPKNFDIKNEMFDFVWNAEDFIKTENNKKWFYIHTVVELCTAVKAAAALHILEQTKTDKLIYLDPDIGVFDNLDSLSKMLDESSVLITPHQTEPAITHQGIIDEEICSLKHGIYNFGFFAVKNDIKGLKFLNWWNDRLMQFCYDDIPNGLFTDQKWGDMIPALFDFAKVVRDPIYNVATWNLATRKITGNSNDGWMVNGKPLAFYHFTGFDSVAHRVMLAQHAKEGDPVWNLSLHYEKMMHEMGQAELGQIPFKYAFYDNGMKISKFSRQLFRSTDVYSMFDNPFSEKCYKWMKANSDDNMTLLKLLKKYIKYKFLYHFSFGKIHKNYKSRYKYYKNKINILSKYL